MSEKTSFVDYYALLRVPVNADSTTIRRTFIQHAKTYHPDVGGSTAHMQQLTKAYRTLINESSRKSYDLLHSFHTNTAEIQYHHIATGHSTSMTKDLTDEEIDEFLDTIYTEYRTQPKQKQSFIQKIKKAL